MTEVITDDRYQRLPGGKRSIFTFLKDSGLDEKSDYINIKPAVEVYRNYIGNEDLFGSQILDLSKALEKAGQIAESIDLCFSFFVEKNTIE